MNIHEFSLDVSDQIYSLFPLKKDISFQYTETAKFFVAIISIGGNAAGFTIPKEYNNLWSQRVDRAVKETLENITMLCLNSANV